MSKSFSDRAYARARAVREFKHLVFCLAQAKHKMDVDAAYDRINWLKLHHNL